MDYGDGVFPCKWHSEVIQDEIQGWMLRVEPIRQAVASYNCGWEEYVDDATNEGRTFFFHRQTFEASYTIPVEVQQERDLAALKAANAQQLGGYYDENKNWVSTNAYIESWMNATAGADNNDFSVLPYPTTASRSNQGGRPPSAGRTTATGPPNSYRGMNSARGIPISGRRLETPLMDHYDSIEMHHTEEFGPNIIRKLFKDTDVKSSRVKM